MSNELLIMLENLKSLLLNDERIMKLNELDELISNDEEVMKLSYRKDMASVDYSDCLKHFNSESNEVSVAQEKLYKAKLALDSHPLVNQYNEAFLKVKNLYRFINKEIFGDFSL